MTASAFSSVSLDPLLVLMCPAKDAECYLGLTEASYFSIHLLAGDQAPLAWQFAKSDVDKTQRGFLWTKAQMEVQKYRDVLPIWSVATMHSMMEVIMAYLLARLHTSNSLMRREPLVYCKSILGPLSPLNAQ